MLKSTSNKNDFFFCNYELETEVYVQKVKNSGGNCKNCAFCSKMEIDLCIVLQCVQSWQS